MLILSPFQAFGGLIYSFINVITIGKKFQPESNDMIELDWTSSKCYLMLDLTFCQLNKDFHTTLTHAFSCCTYNDQVGTHKTTFKLKHDFSSKNETFQILNLNVRILTKEWQVQSYPDHELTHKWVLRVISCYSPMIPSIPIRAIPSVSSWVH